MSLGVSEDHEELKRSAQRWAEAHCTPQVVRSTVESPPGELPALWKEIADQGWLGLHIPERYGGQGFGVAELAVVLEVLGASLAPGPVLTTAVVSGLVARYGSAPSRERWLPGLADGSIAAAVSFGRACLELSGDGDSYSVSGTLPCVTGADTCSVVAAPLSAGGWCLFDVRSEQVSIRNRPAVDATRPTAELTVAGCPVNFDDVIEAGGLHDLATILGTAESSGGSRWCLTTASDYAKLRVQFGRPIGQFQAVKHKLAAMLISAEQASAVAWDAARAWDTAVDNRAHGTDGHTDGHAVGDEAPLAAAIAGAVAIEAFVHNAKECIQLLGGIGFTWEHDAHLYLKRAISNRQLLGGPEEHSRNVAAQATSGSRRTLSAALPEEAEEIRAEVAPLVGEAKALKAEERREFMVDHGLVAPHWPPPWGRGAGALEQLVLDEEFSAAGLRRPHLGVGAWAMPTLIEHGNEAQHLKWVRPTLLGQLNWCQLFSEPGAGSDLASLTTRAQKVEGGWRLTGQKVWTSMASAADFGVCLARTDPDVAKHEGISYFVVDMKSEGVDVRPLREMTGAEMFSEVFLDSVFVEDGALIGIPGGGWSIARTTLANERISMSSGSTFGTGAEALIEHLRAGGAEVTDDQAVKIGALLAEAQSLRLMAHRDALRSLAGIGSGGAESSVRKLLGAEHEQRVQELGMELCGVDGALSDEVAQRWVHGFLATRCLTIAGGTSEIQRNVMAERILGQPRDPEPGEASGHSRTSNGGAG